jgi:hypothetical protein
VRDGGPAQSQMHGCCKRSKDRIKRSTVRPLSLPSGGRGQDSFPTPAFFVTSLGDVSTHSHRCRWESPPIEPAQRVDPGVSTHSHRYRWENRETVAFCSVAIGFNPLPSIPMGESHLYRAPSSNARLTVEKTSVHHRDVMPPRRIRAAPGASIRDRSSLGHRTGPPRPGRARLRPY